MEWIGHSILGGILTKIWKPNSNNEACIIFWIFYFLRWPQNCVHSWNHGSNDENDTYDMIYADRRFHNGCFLFERGTNWLWAIIFQLKIFSWCCGSQPAWVAPLAPPSYRLCCFLLFKNRANLKFSKICPELNQFFQN